MRVFISHVTEDADTAAALARAIAGRGHEVIVRDSNATALGSADAMVVLVSPQSIESPFVRREIEFRRWRATPAENLAQAIRGRWPATSLGAPWPIDYGVVLGRVQARGCDPTLQGILRWPDFLSREGTSVAGKTVEIESKGA